jgi:hypothetical protein
MNFKVFENLLKIQSRKYLRNLYCDLFYWQSEQSEVIFCQF